jgi:hypothetical protein
MSYISCPSVGSCVAIGSYYDTNGLNEGLIETLSNGVWSATTAPLTGLNPPPASSPQSAFQSIGALSCPAPGWCVAMGTYVSAPNISRGLIETLSGGVWTSTTAPFSGLNPAQGSDGSTFTGISCPAPGACVAAGFYWDSTDSSTFGLIETLSNGSWTPMTAPVNNLVPTPSASSR